MSIPVPILDTHIHLYPLAEASTLAWNHPGHPLWGQRSVAEYRAATASSHDLLAGFIFLETDRRSSSSPSSSSTTTTTTTTAINGDEEAAWQHPLAEVAFLARIAAGKPRPGEGHTAADAALCKGIVPWAPIPAGAAALERYLERVKEVCCDSVGDDEEEEEEKGVGAAAREKKRGTTTAATTTTTTIWTTKIKGFRYLVQDKPGGVMLQDGFVESVRLLGRRGFVFDVGVDLHRRGRGQLEEVVALVERAHRGVDDKEKTVFILNHLCKPDLTTLNTNDPSFIAWRTAMFTLSKADNVYMKLSGCLSEMTPTLANAPPNDIFDAIAPWLAVIVAAFGPSRIMFGSDWPVCTVGVGDGAWDTWRLVVERLCLASGFDEDETKMVFWGTGKRAYGVE